MDAPRRYPVRSNLLLTGAVCLAMIGFAVTMGPRDLGPGGILMTLWLEIVVVFIAVILYRALHERGIVSATIEIVDEKDPPPSPAARLAQLEDLRAKKLITATEYDDRRTAILQQL